MVVSGVLTIRNRTRRRIDRVACIRWMVLWIIAAAGIAWPRVTLLCARALGIGRGTDLVLYCAILAGMIGFFYLYLRLRRIDDAITKIVRHYALSDAETKKGEGNGKTT